MPAVVLPRKTIDWQPLREAFVTRETRPTWVEMEAEFAVSVTTLQRCANEEGWASLRAAHLDRKLQQADASSVILAAVQVDRSIVRSLADFALVTLARIKTAVEAIPESRAATTKLSAYNTATFAARNLCAALKDAGIVGLPKGLADHGKAENGHWNPEMLNQINVTVQNLIAKTPEKEAEKTLTQTPTDGKNPESKPIDNEL